MEIDFTLLEPETLENLIDSFILQEGTDYGSYEKSLEEKRQQIMRQLSSGRAVLTFDEETQSCGIVGCDLKKLPHQTC